MTTPGNHGAVIAGSAQGAPSESGNKKAYEAKDDAYFGYYANLQHQAQMLQDTVRTSCYQQAVLNNSADHFAGKVVMDVGAGNGILSLFAAQAGASRVYAVEASEMVQHLQQLCDASTAPPGASISAAPANSWLGGRVVPVHSKVEDVTPDKLGGHEQVDTIVSECLGVLLLHERMCESFVSARDRFLKPGGAMFPSAGTICLAPVEDRTIWDETATKATWWRNNNFYGVDLTPFASAAWNEAFASPIVGCFSPLTLLAPSCDHTISFETVTQQELEEFSVPLRWEVRSTAVVHALGGWFDLHFLPPQPSPPGDDGAYGDDAKMQDAETDKARPAGGQFSKDAAPFVPSGSTEENDPVFLAAAAAAAAALSSAPQVGGSTASGAFMSTSPYVTPTHWQQVRFALAEPLAVNRGQFLVGRMDFRVNDQRSYTLSARLRVTSDGRDPGDEGVAVDAKLERKATWRLDRQTYSWTTANPNPSVVPL